MSHYPQPTIAYRHSDEARSTANTVDSMTKSALWKISSTELSEMGVKMGLDLLSDTVLATKKALVEEILPQRAAVVIEESKADVSAAYADPGFKRRRFFAKLADRKRTSEETYRFRHEKIADVNEFDWSSTGTMVEAAAKIRACSYLLQFEDTDLTLEQVIQRASSAALRIASTGVYRPTNQMSNIIEEAYMKALADIADDWMLVL